MTLQFRRRELIKALALSPLLAMPAGLAANAALTGRRLLLVELQGGNDGLNTVVPYADPAYLQLRPQLGISRDQVLPLDGRLGLNPVLEPLMPLFRDGEMAVVLGLGYEHPNRSHFRGIEIWDTASRPDEILTTGWLVKAATRLQSVSRYSATGGVIGTNAGPLSGPGANTVSFDNSQQFLNRAAEVQRPRQVSGNAGLTHVVQVQRGIREAVEGLDTVAKIPGFPDTAVGRRMAEAANLLGEKAFAPVIKVSHGRFDTHVNQRGTQDRLLREFAEAMAALRKHLKASGLWDKTLVVTYSEFGRRAKENGSHGTDHGTAAPHFVFGGAVKGGLYGEQPRLDALSDGDMVHTVDFRSYYNTVLQRWWGFSDLQLSPSHYKPLDFV